MYKKLFVSLSVLALVSCTETIQEDWEDALTGPLTEAEAKGHHVSYSDIVALTKAQNSETRAYEDQEPKIECITNSSNDTLLYIHQKPTGGWTIYSSDTRVPSIVAESDEGTVEELMQCESVMDWIKCMSEDMETIIKLSDDKLKFSKKEMNANRAFWKSVSSSDEYVKEKLAENGTRALPKFPGGHYKLVYSKDYPEDYDTIPRLTKTDWNQTEYNDYCPRQYNEQIKFEYSDRHAPAGCVPVAAAQMLYFLHFKLGVPETAPTQAWVTGNVKEGYQFDQTNFTSDVWDRFNFYSKYSQMLIANIGKLLGAEYTNTRTRCDGGKVKDKVFRQYGISCIFTEYNPDLLRTNLLNGYPVMLGAKDATGEHGHAFIVDRYKRYRIKTINYYEWVSDKPGGPTTPPPPIPIIPPSMKRYIDTIYSTPIIDAISMNWGDELCPNTGWYTLTGDWIDTCKYPSYRLNWNKERRMWCNFKPINNN